MRGAGPGSGSTIGGLPDASTEGARANPQNPPAGPGSTPQSRAGFGERRAVRRGAVRLPQAHAQSPK